MASQNNLNQKIFNLEGAVNPLSVKEIRRLKQASKKIKQLFENYRIEKLMS